MPALADLNTLASWHRAPFFLWYHTCLCHKPWYHKSKPRGSANFRPGSNPKQGSDTMPKAANVIAFPSKPNIFEPYQLDVEQFMAAYDRDRLFVAMAVRVLTLTPEQIKQSAQVTAGMENDSMARLIRDFEQISKDFAAIGEMAEIAAIRLGLMI
jgi:hypothetical protein